MATQNDIISVTAKAPVNIAVIKYWGKADEKLILALNDSISGTLSIDHLTAKTSAAISTKFSKDRLWLNGEEVQLENNPRMVNCLREIRKISTAPFKNEKIHICSVNNFPTAAGLASSAAGFACLVYSVGHLLQVNDLKTLSIISRQGSGSACRSLYGGFVQWVSGPTTDTSYSQQIEPESHWPEMRVVILVANDKRKDTSSTAGMQLTVNTSELLKHRISHVLPQRVQIIKKAISEKNFSQFAEITMKDSNQFHAVCLDTYPPIRYLNDISWSVIRLIHQFNDFYKENKLAYTFDAGPNACIYLLEDVIDEFLSLIHLIYPNSLNTYLGDCLDKEIKSENIDNGYYKGIPHKNIPIKTELLTKIGQNCVYKDGLKGIISTKLGTGPVLTEDSLLNENGFPK